MDNKSIKFSISDFFIKKNSLLLISEKNTDIGKMAVEIVKLYFKHVNPDYKFKEGKNNEPDLITILNENETSYEIKGTKDSKVAYNKIKISSKYCYNSILNGMQIIRVTDIGKPIVTIYFLKNGIDFLMEPEDRWKIKKLKK